jgi:hypothetical protein
MDPELAERTHKLGQLSPDRMLSHHDPYELPLPVKQAIRTQFSLVVFSSIVVRVVRFQSP